MIKKLLFLVVLALGLTGTVSARNFFIDPCDPDLVAYWKLNEGTGTIAYDSDLQAANNGDLMGNKTRWDYGGEPGTVYLGGSSDYIAIVGGLKHKGGILTTNILTELQQTQRIIFM